MERVSMPQQPLSQVPADATWDWQEIGACREADPELFFHPQNERGLARLRRDRAAKAVCAGCNVRIDCADYAIRAREPYGVWGGLTEEERLNALGDLLAKPGTPLLYCDSFSPATRETLEVFQVMARSIAAASRAAGRGRVWALWSLHRQKRP